MKSLFIFRRDLRIEDNIGLLAVSEESDSVIPCFIFTPEQIDKNPYRSDASLQFLIESLEELDPYLFYGSPDEVVEKCIKTLKIDQVAVNRDYTPYSIKRDQKIEAICKKYGIRFKSYDDALLQPPEKTVKADGKPYTVFTPYFRNSSKLAVLKPQRKKPTHLYTKPIPFAEGKELYQKILPQRTVSPFLKGGRTEALKILKQVKPNKSSYLSPYLKYTLLSPREVYHHLGSHHSLIRSLYWRDFFSHIAFFFPHVFKGAFHQKYDELRWNDDKTAFHKWCEGKTGFPIVDAAMRHLNATGFMPNRMRMIVGSFLTKDLHIHWRLGEKYFAQKLIDYDPAVNNGNWQWVASTGCDAQPYFRIFNPWSQQQKFDPDCQYIKEWMPELADFPSEMIHEGLVTQPMVDHAEEAKKALKNYTSIKQR